MLRIYYVEYDIAPWLLKHITDVLSVHNYQSYRYFPDYFCLIALFRVHKML